MLVFECWVGCGWLSNSALNKISHLYGLTREHLCCGVRAMASGFHKDVLQPTRPSAAARHTQHNIPPHSKPILYYQQHPGFSDKLIDRLPVQCIRWKCLVERREKTFNKELTIKSNHFLLVESTFFFSPSIFKVGSSTF